MNSALRTVALLALLVPGVRMYAQSSTGDNTAELRQRVDDLEKSLALIKAQLAQKENQGGPVADTSSGSVTTTAVAAAKDVAPQAAAAPPADSHADDSDNNSHELGPLQFRGFSDFTYGRPVWDTQPAGGIGGSANAFTLGDFDLFTTSKISNHLSALAEVLVTSDFTNEFSAEIDRLMLTYTINRYFHVSAGKFNTAIGFYTNEFHRARFFQTATGRPLVFSDEDQNGILPVHSIGLSTGGELPSGKLGLHWVAEVANGRAYQNPSAEAVQNFVDENNGKAVNFALVARPEWANGLDFGASFYRDRIHPPGFAEIEQHISSVHIAMVRPHLELLAEGFMLQHMIVDSDHGFNTFAGYGQASYAIGQYRPYLRYDFQNIPASDPVFGVLGRENGPSVGVRYDFTDFSCLKLQYGELSTRTGHLTNDFQAQLAFAF